MVNKNFALKLVCCIMCFAMTVTLCSCAESEPDNGEAKPTDFKRTISDDNYIIIQQYVGEDTTVRIPKEMDGYPVKVIDFNAFYFTKVETVVIPDSVTEIGNYAFCHCPALKNVTFGKGVKKIGDECFAHCFKLEEITLPKNLDSIGNKAFYMCPKLKTVRFPGDAPKNIGTALFTNTHKDLTIYYKEGTKGWEDTILAESFALKTW